MGGFVLEVDARVTLANTLVEYGPDRPVRRAPDTVGGFLMDRWLRGIRREVADSALSNYSTIVANYVVPRIGDVRVFTVVDEAGRAVVCGPAREWCS